MNDDVVYFELNNWTVGIDYPNDEPFLTWFDDDANIQFSNEEWVKSNKLCVVMNFIDMSINFCITASKQWVEDNCPKLLTTYKEFIREPNYLGDVVGEFGHLFLPYKEDNFGILYNENYDLP